MSSVPRRKTSCGRIAAIAAIFTVGAFFRSAFAHELESDRVTIVQREPTHLSVVFHVDEAELIRRMLAPSSTATEFALSMAAMADQPFTRALEEAHRRFAAGARLVAHDGKSLRWLDWRWSANETLRARWREQAMATVVGGGAHDHRPPDEIGVDALADSPVGKVRFTLPATMGEFVVVSYRPTQQRYRPDGRAALDIDFE